MGSADSLINCVTNVLRASDSLFGPQQVFRIPGWVGVVNLIIVLNMCGELERKEIKDLPHHTQDQSDVLELVALNRHSDPGTKYVLGFYRCELFSQISFLWTGHSINRQQR